MKASDIDPSRISKPPSKSKMILAGRAQKNQGYVIRNVEIRQYVERTDERLGDYSLLTVMIETEKGIVEMKYDEGFRGRDALESAVEMLTQHVGLASLINRALIELQRH